MCNTIWAIRIHSIPLFKVLTNITVICQKCEKENLIQDSPIIMINEDESKKISDIILHNIVTYKSTCMYCKSSIDHCKMSTKQQFIILCFEQPRTIELETSLKYMMLVLNICVISKNSKMWKILHIWHIIKVKTTYFMMKMVKLKYQTLMKYLTM